MDINSFNRFADVEICPVCKGNNLKGFRNKYDLTIFECLNCGGVPSYCRGAVYINRELTMSNCSSGDCSNCGEKKASVSDHSYLCRY